MERSQNGWSADPHLSIVPLVVNGVAFAPGVRSGDVHTVLEYVAQQLHARVEPVIDPGCWGFYYRANRNDPNSLSNHSSGTAIDYNAPKHPNGVATVKTWTLRQRGEIRKILAEVDGVVRWGGDYKFTPDAMHFEINADGASVAAVAQKIRAGHLGDDMPLTDADVQKVAAAAAKALLNYEIDDRDASGHVTGKTTVRHQLERIETFLQRADEAPKA